MDSLLDIVPCPKCHGKGYTTRVIWATSTTHPRNKLVENTNICECINKNLPIPEIKNGKLNFILN
jgi:uncharacterized protein YbaR (Trm112 family)|tara:strand:+ start:178 stop:372 length:195 start_codon:yes stop_codon:yes gene_type:complete